MKPVPVGLLTITQPNWKQFIEAAKEAVGYSPTRGLDGCSSPTHRDPAAFLACLDLQNRPLEALRTGRQRGLFKHYFMSFMCIIEEDTIRCINEETRISTWSVGTYQKLYYTTISGTMDQWYDAVVTACRSGSPWEFRSVMNGVYDILINAGFRESFPFNKIDHKDGTFTLDASH